MNSSKQLKIGAIMSYFIIAFNMIAGLIYTPWMIEQIGQSSYGLYTLATSLITMFVMDFGLGGVVTRFISKFNAEGKKEFVNNFLGLVYKLYLVIDAFILSALVVVSFFINTVYDNLTASELETFKVLYVIVGIFSVISFPFTNLNGILTAFECFTQMKLADLFHKVFIIVAMIIALSCGMGVYALVSVNAISGLLTILLKVIIIRKKTGVKVNFRYKDKSLTKEVFNFSMWTTIRMLAERLVINITPSIIAAVSATGSVGVALFGLAQTIEGYVYTFATAIDGMFMPRIAKIVYGDKKSEELLPLMIRIGRIQCMIIGMLVTGFIAVGESFIVDIWNKPDFSESYICAMLLIIPSYFYLPMQIANTTLIVKNKINIRAYVVTVVGIVNVCLSLIFSKYWGAIGASWSIFIAYMLRVVLMAIVYKVVLKFDMWKFFKETFLKITPFLLISMGVGLCLEHLNPMDSGFLRFIVNGCVFVAVFAVIMVLFVMNKSEKDLIFGTIKKVLRKFKIIK